MMRAVHAYLVTTHLFLVHNPKRMCTKYRWLCYSYRRPHLRGYRLVVYWRKDI